MKKIDIITYFDNNHKGLYDSFFFPSYQKHLSKDFNLVNCIPDTYISEDYFQSNNWCRTILNRFDAISNYIKNNSNTWAIFSDIDIIFFDNIKIDIEHYISFSKNIQIWYMAENMKINNIYHNIPNQSFIQKKTRGIPEINGGFFLFYCCEQTESWFSFIKNSISTMDKPNDQTFIQGLLKAQNSNNLQIKFDYQNISREISFGLLNPFVFITNNNPIHDTIKSLRRAKTFHATSSSGSIEKYQILSSAYCKKYNIRGMNLWL